MVEHRLIKKDKWEYTIVDSDSVKLNLGCGDDILEGWVNCDMYSDNPDVMRVDLNKLPLPFKDESVDVILLKQVLEHLTVHPFEFINDCYRILKKDGELVVELPAFSFGLAHIRGFHKEDYLSVLYGGKHGNNCYHNRSSFGLISLKKVFSFRYAVLRILGIVKTLGCENFEWRLRKI